MSNPLGPPPYIKLSDGTLVGNPRDMLKAAWNLATNEERAEFIMGLNVDNIKVENISGLIEELAPSDPMNQDEQGGCVWCGGMPPRKGLYAGRNLKHHSHDCPWVKARLFLGDKLPE